MTRRGPRWTVTYLLRGGSARWTVRAPDEAEAIVRAKYERAGFDRERGLPQESDFSIAFAVPYTSSDAMDDGTSLVSVALAFVLPTIMVLAVMGRHGVGGKLAATVDYGWWLLQVVCAVGFIGFVLCGVVFLVFAGVAALIRRFRGTEE